MGSSSSMIWVLNFNEFKGVLAIGFAGLPLIWESFLDLYNFSSTDLKKFW